MRHVRADIDLTRASLFPGGSAIVAYIAAQLPLGRQHRDADAVDDGKRPAGALGHPLVLIAMRDSSTAGLHHC